MQLTPPPQGATSVKLACARAVAFFSSRWLAHGGRGGSHSGRIESPGRARPGLQITTEVFLPRHPTGAGWHPYQVSAAHLRLKYLLNTRTCRVSWFHAAAGWAAAVAFVGWSGRRRCWGVRTAPWLQKARLTLVAASLAVALGRLRWVRTLLWMVARATTGPYGAVLSAAEVTALLADFDEAPSPGVTIEAVLQQALGDASDHYGVCCRGIVRSARIL